MNVRKKRVLSCLIIVGTLFLYLLFSNRLVNSIQDKGYRLTQIDFEDLQNTAVTIGSIEKIDYDQEDLFEHVRISGWAFSESTDSSDNKKIYLVFKDGKRSYISAPANPFIRSAVSDFYRNNYDISSDYHAFQTEISTVLLPRGYYEIYIYVEENENSKGIINTGKRYHKNGILFENATEATLVDNLIMVENTPQIEAYADCFILDDQETKDYIMCQGFGFIYNLNSESQKLYLVFSGNNGKRKNFEVNTEHFLYDVLTSPLYSKSYYQTLIPKSELPDEAGSISMVLVNEDKIFNSSIVRNYSINNQ